MIGDVMREFYKVILSRSLLVMVVFIFLLAISFGSVEKGKNYVANVNGVKSVEANRMVLSYEKNVKKVEFKQVSNMEEAALYGADTPISFDGQMTAYKANCPGCNGGVACPPGRDVTGDNYFYEDETYGRIRILAADPHIPCGTIVSFTNVSFSNEPIIGIVLDRGGAIKGNIMDFLVGPNDDMDIVGRQRGVHYEVLRWGY